MNGKSKEKKKNQREKGNTTKGLIRKIVIMLSISSQKCSISLNNVLIDVNVLNIIVHQNVPQQEILDHSLKNFPLSSNPTQRFLNLSILNADRPNKRAPRST